MIRYEALATAHWNPEPYPWSCVPELLDDGTCSQLVEGFPTTGFAFHQRVGGRTVRQFGREVVKRSGRALVLDQRATLDPPWRRLLTAFLSADYAARLGTCASMDLEPLSLEISLWRMPSGCFNPRHGNDPRKRLTQVVYLGGAGGPVQGGELVIHGAGEGTQGDVVLPATGGTSVVFACSPEAWHEVRRVTGGERLSVGLHFYQGAIS